MRGAPDQKSSRLGAALLEMAIALVLSLSVLMVILDLFAILAAKSALADALTRTRRSQNLFTPSAIRTLAEQCADYARGIIPITGIACGAGITPPCCESAKPGCLQVTLAPKGTISDFQAEVQYSVPLWILDKWPGGALTNGRITLVSSIVTIPTRDPGEPPFIENYQRSN